MAIVTEQGDRLAVLAAVQDRVLWLAMSIVHHANKVRENRSGV
jgi:pyruvate dehydrogenase E1 component